mgnify:CR=1 FL=1
MGPIAEWVDGWARRDPTRPAIHYDGETLDYGAFAALIERTVTSLSSMGVSRGTRVALLAYNSPLYLAYIFAASRLGAIVVPLNWRLAPPEHAFILADSGARYLLGDPVLLNEAIRSVSPATVLSFEEEIGRAHV